MYSRVKQGSDRFPWRKPEWICKQAPHPPSGAPGSSCTEDLCSPTRAGRQRQKGPGGGTPSPPPYSLAFLLAFENLSLSTYFVWAPRAGEGAENAEKRQVLSVPSRDVLEEERRKAFSCHKVQKLDQVLETPGCGWVGGDKMPCRSSDLNGEQLTVTFTALPR